MKTIGIIGGLTWVSTAEYYRLINEGVRGRLGGVHSARLLLHSFDFQDFAGWQAAGDETAMRGGLVAAARGLRGAGADFLLIASNTPHRFADDVSAAAGLPLLHIAEAAASAIVAGKMTKVGLLGTKPTMELEFYKARLGKRGIECLIPGADARDKLHSIIFEELAKGEFHPRSKRFVLDEIAALAGRGAQGIVLGCTEFPLLIKAGDCDLPLFDTTALHASAAVAFALDESKTN